jgi:hypothetical protein
MPEPPDFPEKVPVSVFGIPVRVDATLCAPGEIWIEGPSGDAVRVLPEPEKDPPDA